MFITAVLFLIFWSMKSHWLKRWQLTAESLQKLKFYPSVLLLMVKKMSHSAREKLDSYCEIPWLTILLADGSTGWQSYWMQNCWLCLSDWPTGWQCDWFIDWLINLLMEWLDYWLTESLTHRQRQTYGLTDWLTDRSLKDWLADSLADRLTDRLTDRRTDWPTDRLTD